MAGCGGQAGVVSPFHTGVGLQEVRHGAGVHDVAVHADGERLDPAEQEEGVERTEDAAVGVPAAQDLLAQVRVPGRDDAGQGVAVPAEVLGGAVQHHVGPVVHRPEEIGGQEGIVDYDLRAGRVGLADHRGRVDDVQRGIGQGLEVHHVGGLLEGRVHLLRVPHVDHLGIETQPGQFLGHEMPGPGVGGVVAHDPGSRADKRHHGLGDRGHAAGGGDAAAAAFEGAHLLLESREGGVASPQVGPVHRRRLVDRRRRRVLRLARVDGPRDESVVIGHFVSPFPATAARWLRTPVPATAARSLRIPVPTAAARWPGPCGRFPPGCCRNGWKYGTRARR